MRVPDKITYIEQTLYPHSELFKSVVLLGLGPIASAALFIFAYPYPAQFAYRFWRTRQKELNDIKKEIEGSTLLSKEESIRLREYAYALEAEYAGQLEKYAKEIESLKKKIKENPIPAVRSRSNAERMPVSFRQEERERYTQSNPLKTWRVAPKHRASASSPSTPDLVKVLLAKPFTYQYVPATDKTVTRSIEFKSKGKIGVGRSSEDSTWGIQSGYLNLYDNENELTGSFRYDAENARFVEVDDRGADISNPRTLVRTSA
jgi:hypothetical protein